MTAVFKQVSEMCNVTEFKFEDINIHETYLNYYDFYYFGTVKNKKTFMKKVFNYLEEFKDTNNLIIHEMYIKELVLGKIKNKNIYFILCESEKLIIFNDLKRLILWLFYAYFSSDRAGCACEKCNQEKLDYYNEKYNAKWSIDDIKNEIVRLLG